MANNTVPSSPYSLSDLIFHKIQPDDETTPESTADGYLSQGKYEEALSSYCQLASSNPRIAAKTAYCEWLVGRYDDARNRLIEFGEALDADGVGLLSKLISIDRDYQRSNYDEKLIWPRLKAVTSAISVPLFAAFARFQTMWPGDAHNPTQRLQDIEYLLSLHPNCQPLRLALLTCMQRVGTPIDDQYSLLHAWQYPSLMPRYLWSAAGVATDMGKFDEALDYLSQLEARERHCVSPSLQVLWEIELARCDIQAKTNTSDSLSGFENLGKNPSYSVDNRIIASRAALAVACKVEKNKISSLADSFLNMLQSSEYGVEISPIELFNDPTPFMGNDWDDYAISWPYGDLTPYKELLINSTQGRTQRFFRAISVTALLAHEYEDTDTPDLNTNFWDNLAELLGDVTDYPEEFDGKLLSLHTVIHSHRTRPNWAKMGQYWITSKWLAHQTQQDLPYNWLISETIGNNEDYTRKFSSGVIKQLKTHPIPAPEAYDLVKELVDYLIEYHLKKELHQLMVTVSDGDERSSVQFCLGWSSQLMNDKSRATSSYLKVLIAEPDNYSAIFNMLLLCTTQADRPLLEKLEQHVIQFGSHDADKKQELTGALAKAQKRCEDINAVKKQIIANYLSKYPPLMEHKVKPEDISLRTAVALLALFRCANAEPDDIELPSLDESSSSFSPVISNRSILFNLLDTGLATVQPNTSLDAFSVTDGTVDSIRFGRIRWRMSQSCELLVKQLRSLNGNIPKHWHKELKSFVREIAEGEVAEYLGSLAQERGWPEPRNTENLSDLTRELINELPVAQAFHLAYLGAMSASDYKQKYPVSGQQAADMLVKRTGDRLESVRSGKFPAKPYERPWKLPRSAISFALWGTLLNRGDDGFTQKVADLTPSF